MNHNRPTTLASTLVLVIATLALSGCVRDRPVALGGATAVPTYATGAQPVYEAAANEQFSNALAPDDEISITVVREPEISLPSVTITPAGTVDMPMIGIVTMAGRAPHEVAAEIRDRLRASFLRDAEVAVNVVRWSSHKVTVEGAVASPGIYSYGSRATLLDAISLAKGPLRTARLGRVVVFRQDGQERSLAVFDLARIRAGEMADPHLRPGDRVVVGFSALTQGWQDFLQSTPLIGIFTRF